MKNYFRRLAQGYENGKLSSMLYPVLDFSSCVYGQAVASLRNLHEKKVLRRTKLPFPVISIGNLTWGGTGKTPFVEYLVRKISESQRAALILTRGYGNDEVEQFKTHLPNVLLGVGKNRTQVAQEVAKKNRVDVAVLDDGLQHWALERDLEIITVNALNPFGNGKLLPRGILREPVHILKRAAIVVISHANLISAKELESLKSLIKEKAPDASILETYLEPLFFYRARKRARVPVTRLQNQRVATFSGVGTPRSFQLVLSRLQIRPIRNFEFPDHHVFSEQELREVKDVSDAAAAQEIVTTEKDFYRCPDLITEILNPLVLAARLRISSGEEILRDRLSRLLGVTSA